LLPVFIPANGLDGDQFTESLTRYVLGHEIVFVATAGLDRSIQEVSRGDGMLVSAIAQASPASILQSLFYPFEDGQPAELSVCEILKRSIPSRATAGGRGSFGEVTGRYAGFVSAFALAEPDRLSSFSRGFERKHPEFPER
jgi:hypothetical protein